MQTKRALLFRLPGDESAQNALNLARNAQEAGLDVTMVPYWPDNQPCWHSEHYLLAENIGSAPRVSAFALEQRYGLTLDLLDLQAHNLATEPIQPDLLLPESIWQQRLRGIATLLIDLFSREKPDVVFIAHGAEVVSRLVTEIAAFMQVKALFWESGFFANHLYLDTQAPHFFRGLSSADTTPIKQSTSEHTSRFIANWKLQRQSKYVQNTQDLDRFEAWNSADSRPILFVAGQVPSDANAIIGLGLHTTLYGLYTSTLKLPETWRMVFKAHPKANKSHAFIEETNSRDVFCGDIPVIDAIENSTAVLVHSSNVGLEALLVGKPTLVTGQPIYSINGQTIHIENCERLDALLCETLPSPNPYAVAGFVEHLLSNCLVDIQDSQSLGLRVAKAQIPQRDRKLLSHYSIPLQKLVSAMRDLHTALKTTPRLADALARLSPKARDSLAAHIQLETLAGHTYGGGILPASYAALHPSCITQELECIALPARLEECPYPLEYLRSQLREGSKTYSIGCDLSDAAERPSAQTFSTEDLMDIASRLGRKLEIVHFDNDRDALNGPVTLYLRPQALEAAHYPVTRYADWDIPSEAFNKPDNVATDNNGNVILCGDHVHGVYGPYISIPEGVWQISWARRKSGGLDWLKSRLFKKQWKKIHFEVVENLEGADQLVQSVPYANFVTIIVAKAQACYELRPHWQGKAVYPSAKLPVFDGLCLRWIGPARKADN